MTHFIYEWETVAVTALPPGWRNVYRDHEGSLITSPCPAVLLQEHRSTTKVAKLDGLEPAREHRTDHEPPYATRAVFADVEVNRLEPADDASNYLGTVGPDQDPAALDPQETS